MRKKYLSLSYLYPLRPVNRVVDRFHDHPLGDLEFLISTYYGLYLFSEGELIKLLDGQFYGITHQNGAYYVFQKLINRGRIVKFRLEGQRLRTPKPFIRGLSAGIHQIDFVGETLHAIDTYHNRILRFHPRSWKVKVREFYPVGRLDHDDRRKANNYVHMNSIWMDDDHIYIMLHNETIKTGKSSEILKLTRNLSVSEIIPTAASAGHNYVRYNGMELLCNSKDGELMDAGTAVFKCDRYTRGLAVTDRHIILGASAVGERRQRLKLEGNVFVTDHSFNMIFDFKIAGQIYDIRAVNQVDYSYCNAVRDAELVT